MEEKMAKFQNKLALGYQNIIFFLHKFLSQDVITFPRYLLEHSL